MKKYAIYTAIFNDYDWLKEPVGRFENIEFICYTDNKNLKSKIWNIRHVDLAGSTASLKNREIKLLYPYTELKEYEYSMYVDGSMMIKGDVHAFFERYTKEKLPLMNFRHPNNDCIFEEIKRCIKQNRGNSDKLLEQYVIYINDNMPKHYGLSDNKILLRDNRSELGYQLMQEWYGQVVNYSGRDQVCLAYVLYKHNMHFRYFQEDIERNEFFETWPHNNTEWYIRAWRHFKWYCECHHILTGLVRKIENNIKPHFLNQ